MGAFALLALPKIAKGLEKGHVVIDGLYSWSEYKILKRHFPMWGLSKQSPKSVSTEPEGRSLKCEQNQRICCTLLEYQNVCQQTLLS